MQNKKIYCQVCGSKTVDDLHRFPGYYYCGNCQTAWLKKIPNSSYETDYYQGKSGFASKLFSPIGIFFYWIRQKYAGSTNHNLWIDVGAGEGNFLNTVKARKKIGVEISKDGRELMQKKGLEIMTPQQFLASNKLNASAISFWHVLEHIQKPEEYIEAARKNLAANGKIIIGVPNIKSLEFRLFNKHWFHLAPQFHLWHFSPKSIKVMLERNGFVIQQIDFWSIEHNLAGILQTFLNRSTKTQNILHQIVKRGTNPISLSLADILWCLFWLTLGLPIIIFFWIAVSLTQQSGSFIVVASKIRESKYKV